MSYTDAILPATVPAPSCSDNIFFSARNTATQYYVIL